jgi:hypothetical protein
MFQYLRVIYWTLSTQFVRSRGGGVKDSFSDSFNGEAAFEIQIGWVIPPSVVTLSLEIQHVGPIGERTGRVLGVMG